MRNAEQEYSEKCSRRKSGASLCAQSEDAFGVFWRQRLVPCFVTLQEIVGSCCRACCFVPGEDLSAEDRFVNSNACVDVCSALGKQLRGILEHPALRGSHVALMPDAHVGNGIMVGFTARQTDIAIPALIGGDIGCGVLAVRLGTVPRLQFPKLDRSIRYSTLLLFTDVLHSHRRTIRPGRNAEPPTTEEIALSLAMLSGSSNVTDASSVQNHRQQQMNSSVVPSVHYLGALNASLPLTDRVQHFMDLLAEVVSCCCFILSCNHIQSSPMVVVVCIGCFKMQTPRFKSAPATRSGQCRPRHTRAEKAALRGDSDAQTSQTPGQNREEEQNI